jgi:quercetin dioxygenase-like cupin family protein
MQAKPKIVPPGASKAPHILGDKLIYAEVGAETGGADAVQQQETRPGGGPPLHRHSREDEGFTVLAGEYLFWVGEQSPISKAEAVAAATRKAPKTPTDFCSDFRSITSRKENEKWHACKASNHTRPAG